MKFYRTASLSTIPVGQDSAGDAGLTGADAAGTARLGPGIVVRAADLLSPAGRVRPLGPVALVVAGTPQIRTEDQPVLVKVIAVAPAVVRRDGRVRPAGIPLITPGWARLSSSSTSCWAPA